jgi:hypothetical protein
LATTADLERKWWRLSVERNGDITILRQPEDAE